MLKAAEHPNIVTVYEAGELRDGRIYVSMEYMEKGSLEDEAKGAYIKLSRAKRLMSDVLRGLHYAHEQGIVHRDIKPANILIGSSDEGILSDFGLALPNIEDFDFSTVKNYQYLTHLAPEVNSLEDYSIRADIYAAGVTLYRLVNGDNYLPSMPPTVARKQARKGLYPNRKNYRGFVSNRMRNLINTAIEVKPDDRFKSADEMRHNLEQVSTQIDWEETRTASGKIWTGRKSNLKISVERIKEKDGRWTIAVKKGKVKLRNDNVLSKAGMTERGAKQHAYRLLQRFVNK